MDDNSQTKKIDETPNMVEDLLRGLTVQRQGVVDTSFVDDLYAHPLVVTSIRMSRPSPTRESPLISSIPSPHQHRRNYMFSTPTWNQVRLDAAIAAPPSLSSVW
jgi:hypothetical protein